MSHAATSHRSTDAGPALLSVRGLNAWYGESHALHGVDLDIASGETITLIGRNGVGKTTTLRAIMGIIPKRTGTIRFDGRDMMPVPLHRTAHHGIGFVPEERGIFASLTVEENLTLPPVVGKGGMGSIGGAIVTGYLLGLCEGLTKVFYPEASNIVVFVIMALVLLVRPAGLFGRA